MSTIQIRTAHSRPEIQGAFRAPRESRCPAAFPWHARFMWPRPKTPGSKMSTAIAIIDFAGGIGCVNVGHRAPRVVEAVEGPARSLPSYVLQVTPYESYVRLAERMNESRRAASLRKHLLVNSGAEAVENAIKIARAYTKRPAIIAFEDAFHGRTIWPGAHQQNASL